MISPTTSSIVPALAHGRELEISTGPSGSTDKVDKLVSYLPRESVLYVHLTL